VKRGTDFRSQVRVIIAVHASPEARRAASSVVELPSDVMVDS